MNSTNICVTTHIFSLTVSSLDLGACNSWSKEQYFITRICQAAYTIRPQISSVSRVKDDLQEWWRPPGKTDVAEERARTGRWTPGAHQSSFRTDLPSVSPRPVSVSTTLRHKVMTAISYTLRYRKSSGYSQVYPSPWFQEGFMTYEKLF